MIYKFVTGLVTAVVFKTLKKKQLNLIDRFSCITKSRVRLKLFLFRIEFKLSKLEEESLFQITSFIIKRDIIDVCC